MEKVETKEDYIRVARGFGYSEADIAETVKDREALHARGVMLSWDVGLTPLPTDN